MAEQDPKDRLRKLETAIKAASSARSKVLTRIAIQTTPYIMDRMQGFAIQLRVSGRKEHRFVLVTLAEGEAQVRLFDTVAARNRDLDQACVASLSTRDWAEVGAFLEERVGIRLRATCKGNEAEIRLSGRYLAIHESLEGRTSADPCALVDFVSGHGPQSVQVTCLPDGPRARGLYLAGWDWISVEADLAANGVTLKASLVEAEA